jgi:hypothetical protein
METSEKSGFFLIVIAALLYLGVQMTGMKEPGRTFVLLLAALAAFGGAVLLLDWVIALAIRRIYESRQAMAQPALSVLSVVSRLSSDQVELVEKLGVVRQSKADYSGTIRHVYISPWGKEIPAEWIAAYLSEVEKSFPRLRPVSANGEGTIERQYNSEFTNWMLLWKLAVRDNARAGAEWVISLADVRERLGL